jgi:hypothetical protein
LDPQVANSQVRPIVRRSVRGGFHSLSPSPSLQYQQWAELAVMEIMLHIPCCTRPGEYRWLLDDLERFLTEVALPDVPLVSLAGVFTRMPPAGHAPPPDLNSAAADGRLSKEAVLSFYDRLEQSGRPLNALYARLGRLGFKVCTNQGSLDLDQVAAEADALLAEVSKYDTGEPFAQKYIVGRYRQCLRDLHTPAASGSARFVPWQDPTLGKPTGERQARLQVRFVPIAGTPAPWHSLVQCTDTLDAMWSEATIHVLREAARPEVIYQVAKERTVGSIPCSAIGPPAWDGENFWIGHASAGIRLVSPVGDILGQADADDGLPPYTPKPYRVADYGRVFDAPLHLHPLGPGRCLVIGQFGPDHRLWFAIVSRRRDEVESARLQIEVFHTATKVLRSDEEVGGVDVSFKPGRAAMCTLPNGRRLLLVGRDPLPGQTEMATRGLLTVDASNLDVSVAQAVLPSKIYGTCWHAIEGHVLMPSRAGIDLFAPVDAALNRWEGRSLVTLDRRSGERLAGVVLMYRGHLYLPGSHRWYRIDPKAWIVEPIQVPGRTDGDKSDGEEFERYAVSAHYGPVAWKIGGVLHQVKIEPLVRP